MTTMTTKKLRAYEVEIDSMDKKYSIKKKVNKFDNSVLTTLSNSRITQLKNFAMKMKRRTIQST